MDMMWQEQVIQNASSDSSFEKCNLPQRKEKLKAPIQKSIKEIIERKKLTECLI